MNKKLNLILVITLMVVLFLSIFATFLPYYDYSADEYVIIRGVLVSSGVDDGRIANADEADMEENVTTDTSEYQNDDEVLEEIRHELVTFMGSIQLAEGIVVPYRVVVDVQSELMTFDHSISLATYIWFPRNHRALSDYIAANVTLPGRTVDGIYIPHVYRVNDILIGGLLIPFVALILLGLLIVVLKKRSSKLLIASATLIWGIWGLIVFATNPVLRLGGAAMFGFFHVIFIAAIVASLALMLMELLKAKKKENV